MGNSHAFEWPARAGYRAPPLSAVYILRFVIVFRQNMSSVELSLTSIREIKKKTKQNKSVEGESEIKLENRVILML